ncbi:Uncharacterised protein [Vibrio cholerae]|nr:Uncharacterised protein [Vibrio cholerae]
MPNILLFACAVNYNCHSLLALAPMHYTNCKPTLGRAMCVS